MDGHDDLETRLRDLGRQPVDEQVATRHLSAMASARPPAGERRWRFGPRAVAAAAMVGFLAGSTGLAAAGNLPDPAQDVAHDVLGAVGLNVPRSTDGCPEGRTYRNHGEYVSEVEAAGGDVEAASHSECGKPVRGGRGGGNGNANRPAGVPRPDTDGDPCTGPPPWAGAHLPAAERAALQEAHRAQCGEDEAEELETEAPEAEVTDEPEPETPTTEAPTTTTVAETPTTVEEPTTTTTG